MNAREALKRLRDGNRRFVAGTSNRTPFADQERREQLLAGQEPFAVVLGCADSRVPPEILFDQGLGELFVVRVAGNIASPSQVGSIEYAAAHLGVRLVVVLGHSRCGAVQATVDRLANASGPPGGHLGSIIDRIRPAVEPLLAQQQEENRDVLVEKAIKKNVCASANLLRKGSDVLSPLIAGEGLLIVGAHYSLKTGVAEFFDGVDERVA